MFGLRMGNTPQEDYPIRFHREIHDSNNYFRLMALAYELLSVLVSDTDNSAYTQCLENKEFFIQRDVDINKKREKNSQALPNKFGNSTRNSHNQHSPDSHKVEIFSKRPTSAFSQVSGTTRLSMANVDLDVTQEDIVFKKYV